jgi:hypothetical protein
MSCAKVTLSTFCSSECLCGIHPVLQNLSPRPVNTRRIVVFGAKSALLTSRDEECGFSQENGEQHREDPFEAVVRIYPHLQRRPARREIGPPTSARL